VAGESRCTGKCVRAIRSMKIGGCAQALCVIFSNEAVRLLPTLFSGANTGLRSRQENFCKGGRTHSHRPSRVLTDRHRRFDDNFRALDKLAAHGIQLSANWAQRLKVSPGASAVRSGMYVCPRG